MSFERGDFERGREGERERGRKKHKDLMQFGKLHYNHGVNAGISKNKD